MELTSFSHVCGQLIYVLLKKATFIRYEDKCAIFPKSESNQLTNGIWF